MVVLSSNDDKGVQSIDAVETCIWNVQIFSKRERRD